MNALLRPVGAVLALFMTISSASAASSNDEACTVLKTQISIYADLLAAAAPKVNAARKAPTEALAKLAKNPQTMSSDAGRIRGLLLGVEIFGAKLNMAAGAMDALGCE